MDYTEKLKAIDWLTYNVVKLEIPKPDGFDFEVGDAVELQVEEQDPGPFTMTNLPDEDVLEFIIRVYKDHHGKTEALSKMKHGDAISFTEPFNTYKPQERSVFLAGGTGITPFIAIMRKMYKDNKLKDCNLYFANKTKKDAFLDDELEKLLDDRFQHVISEDKDDPDYYGNIDQEYLREHIYDLSRPFLVCGPPPFNEAMEKALKGIGVKDDHIDLGS